MNNEVGSVVWLFVIIQAKIMYCADMKLRWPNANYQEDAIFSDKGSNHLDQTKS